MVDLEVAASVGTRSMNAMIYDLSTVGCLIEATGDSLAAAISAINLYIPDVNAVRGTSRLRSGTQWHA